MFNLTIFSLISIVILGIVYFFLITEKLNKVIVAALGAVMLIVLQVFKTSQQSSQEGALTFVYHNLDILGFVIGMMVLIGIVKESGLFEAIAIWLVKLVKGHPVGLLAALGYLTLTMTALFSNIPTIIILTPVLLVLIKELKLPYLPYFFFMITMANLAGAMTPISDPTTYYQAKTVGLGFLEVLSNSGLIVMLLSVVAFGYTWLVFKTQLQTVTVKAADIAQFNPKLAIKNPYVLKLGTPLLLLAIGLMISKRAILDTTGISLDNATIAIGAATVATLLFHKDPKKIFRDVIDWEIIFFFTGLFVVVGALEFTRVIDQLADVLVKATDGALPALIFIVSTGSGILSTFIDNVPYNITMVGAIQAMADAGIQVYPLWWALNLGTSIGGAGSPIAAACNVLAFSQADRDGYHTNFLKYLLVAFPLVIVNSLIVFGILWWRFG